MSSSLYDLGQWATTKKRCSGSYSAHMSTKKLRAFHGLYSTKMTNVFVVRHAMTQAISTEQLALRRYVPTRLLERFTNALQTERI